MSLGQRLLYAARAALLHFGICLVVASVIATVVFMVWYPNGLHQLTGGGALFIILMAVDVVCGPVLTLILYTTEKSQKKWRIDLCLIVLTQATALSYGLIQVANARPIFLAFEGDRFRVVQGFDIDKPHLKDAQKSLQVLSWFGPKLIGVRLSTPGEPDYLESVQKSIQGLHPSFRPLRWRPYSDQKSLVIERLISINELRLKNPDRLEALNFAIHSFNLAEEKLGYLPLVRDIVTDWVIIIDRSTGIPVGYLHYDGW